MHNQIVEPSPTPVNTLPYTLEGQLHHLYRHNGRYFKGIYSAADENGISHVVETEIGLAQYRLLWDSQAECRSFHDGSYTLFVCTPKHGRHFLPTVRMA